MRAIATSARIFDHVLMIWIAFGVMLFAAVVIVAWPLYRREKHLSPSLLATVGTVLVLSTAVYWKIGTPVAPQAHESIEAMVDLLERRLAKDPADTEGWKMLGRLFLRLENYPRAIPALERAVELESAGNAETLVDLGAAVLNNDETTITGRAGQLFEKAIAIEPHNSRALFYGGVAAVARGEQTLAAERWEDLLAQSPPPEIEAIVRQGIADWRGAGSSGTGAEPPTPAVAAGPVVEVRVSLGQEAAAKVGPQTTVFIIARDPAQPSPPLAAVRRKAAELPLTVALSDDDAMLPGRSLSVFRELEIVARASISGEPRARAGDWYGEATIAPSNTRTVDIVIEQQVP